jgi:class 3 adenylate cyclase
VACRPPARPVMAVDPDYAARRGPRLVPEGAGVACMPSTPRPSRTVRMCGDDLQPSPTTRYAREDVHALSGMPETTTVEATFVFADIAGFTALTEAHGDHDAAALVAGFCRSVRAELPASGGTEVKTIGDAVMLTIPDPAAAIRLGLRITHELMRGHGAPAVRVGLHHGPAIERDGDYFGAAVNLAARVSGEASGGEVLLTASTAARAAELDGCSTSRVAAGRSETCASPWSCSRPSAQVSRANRRLRATPSAAWPSIPSARPAAPPTRTRPTSSARSPAPPSSRGSPSASRASRARPAGGRSCRYVEAEHRPAFPIRRLASLDRSRA